MDRSVARATAVPRPAKPARQTSYARSRVVVRRASGPPADRCWSREVGGEAEAPAERRDETPAAET